MLYHQPYNVPISLSVSVCVPLSFCIWLLCHLNLSLSLSLIFSCWTRWVVGPTHPLITLRVFTTREIKWNYSFYSCFKNHSLYLSHKPSILVCSILFWFFRDLFCKSNFISQLYRMFVITKSNLYNKDLWKSLSSCVSYCHPVVISVSQINLPPTHCYPHLYPQSSHS